MGKVETSAGITLSVSGISRKVLDAFLHYRTPPEPPLKIVKAYKGFEEQVPDYDDPQYQEAYIHYVTAIAMDRFNIVINAVTFDIQPMEHPVYLKLREAGIATGNTEQDIKSEFIRFVALDKIKDIAVVMDEILYLSTVTQRGIDEASDRYNVTWLGKRVEAFGVPKSKATYLQPYEDRDAAMEYHVPWEQFIQLSGSEQSAIVAHYRIRRRLAWLDSQDRQSKVRK